MNVLFAIFVIAATIVGSKGTTLPASLESSFHRQHTMTMVHPALRIPGALLQAFELSSIYPISAPGSSDSSIGVTYEDIQVTTLDLRSLQLGARLSGGFRPSVWVSGIQFKTAPVHFAISKQIGSISVSCTGVANATIEVECGIHPEKLEVNVTRISIDSTITGEGLCTIASMMVPVLEGRVQQALQNFVEQRDPAAMMSDLVAQVAAFARGNGTQSLHSLLETLPPPLDAVTVRLAESLWRQSLTPDDVHVLLELPPLRDVLSKAANATLAALHTNVSYVISAAAAALDDSPSVMRWVEDHSPMSMDTVTEFVSDLQSSMTVDLWQKNILDAVHHVLQHLREGSSDAGSSHAQQGSAEAGAAVAALLRDPMRTLRSVAPLVEAMVVAVLQNRTSTLAKLTNGMTSIISMLASRNVSSASESQQLAPAIQAILDPVVAMWNASSSTLPMTYRGIGDCLSSGPLEGNDVAKCILDSGVMLLLISLIPADALTAVAQPHPMPPEMVALLNGVQVLYNSSAMPEMEAITLLGVLDSSHEDRSTPVHVEGCPANAPSCFDAFVGMDMFVQQGQASGATALASPESALPADRLLSVVGPVFRATWSNVFRNGSTRLCPAGSLDAVFAIADGSGLTVTAAVTMAQTVHGTVQELLAPPAARSMPRVLVAPVFNCRIAATSNLTEALASALRIKPNTIWIISFKVLSARTSVRMFDVKSAATTTLEVNFTFVGDEAPAATQALASADADVLAAVGIEALVVATAYTTPAPGGISAPDGTSKVVPIVLGSVFGAIGLVIIVVGVVFTVRRGARTPVNKLDTIVPVPQQREADYGSVGSAAALQLRLPTLNGSVETRGQGMGSQSRPRSLANSDEFAEL